MLSGSWIATSEKLEKLLNILIGKFMADYCLLTLILYYNPSNIFACVIGLNVLRDWIIPGEYLIDIRLIILENRCVARNIWRKINTIAPDVKDILL